jgi:hypothetical protein
MVNGGTDSATQPTVDVWFPRHGAMALTAVVDKVAEAPRLQPYSDEVIGFCATFAHELARRARGMPELQALAFWMRKAELHRLREDFRALCTTEVLLMPRGMVFHVPPANVDTIFVYAWLLAVLAGNSNVVRLPSRESQRTELILDVLTEVAARKEHATLAGNTLMLRYGHDEQVTAALSRIADVRVIWGGDATVAEIRRFGIPPHALELTFPSRSSLAAIDAEYYNRLDEAGRESIAERFFNDSYWFDQLGCSSPRLVCWVGSEQNAKHASRVFFEHLSGVVSRKGYRADTATAIDKLTYACRAVLDQPVTEVRWLSNEVAVLPLERFVATDDAFSGAGTFYQLRCDRLVDLASCIGRRDQTLGHEGFGADELRNFAITLNGRGIDRMVPIGDALTFNRFWDGNDLLQAFTRRVLVATRDGHSRPRETAAD